MATPAPLVRTARICWNWQWNQLMNALAPSDAKGNYDRPKSEKEVAIVPLKETLSGRTKNNLPILIIGKSCPWAHRTWLTYLIKELKDNINLNIAEPSPKEGRWHLNQSILGCNYLDVLYKVCESEPNLRATVPALIDPLDIINSKPKLLCNESATLIEILNKWPTSIKTIDLAPKNCTTEIKTWHKLLQETVNNGVYKCGFARNQVSYDKSSHELFNSLEKIEKSLADKGPWLCGESLTLADIRLFPTLIRWENVYMPFFGCSQRPLWSFPYIWSWRKRFFNLPKVAETCDANAWRKDYFGNLFPLRPSGIIPAGTQLNNIVNSQVPICEQG